MEATTPAYPTRLSETQWATLAAYFAADSQLGGPARPTCGLWSRPFCMCCGPAAPGACCRRTSRLGRPCMATSDAGATTALGNAFTATCAPWVRLQRKRHQSPSVAIADTQSVPLGCFTHRARGFDGGKRLKGRKRHVLVDSMGLLLAVVVTAANIADRQGLPPLLRRLQFRRGWFHRLRLIWGDRAYGDTCCSSGSWSSSTACWRCWSPPRGRLFRVVPRAWWWSAPWPGFPGAGGSARTMKSCHALRRLSSIWL